MFKLWGMAVRRGCSGHGSRKTPIALPPLTLLTLCIPSYFLVQGFSSLSDKVTSGSTVWNISSLPQNRELSMLGAGDGSLYLYKYHYPDQRKVKVSGRGGHMFAQSRDQATEPVQIDPCMGEGGMLDPSCPAV